MNFVFTLRQLNLVHTAEGSQMCTQSILQKYMPLIGWKYDVGTGYGVFLALLKYLKY